MKRTALLQLMFLTRLAGYAFAADGPPQIIDPPLTQFAWAGRPVTLKVSITNTAPVTYQWLWQGSLLPSATNKTFRMATAQVTNSGDYRVVLANSAGSVTSTVARLTVREWPQPTGIGFTNLSKLETNLQALMRTHAVPGAQLAVMKDGRLIATRGYGYADPENSEELVQPDSLFPIASLSKAITAAAVLKLVDDGWLNLDDAVFPLLNLPSPTFPGALMDPRLTNITIRQCLNHTAGWNRNTARNPDGGVKFDPQNWLERCARDMRITHTLTAQDMAIWTTGFPLQANPGTQFSYSNNGYRLAGLLIERIAQLPYEAVVGSLLREADVTRLRIPGAMSSERRFDEVVQWLSPTLDVRGLGGSFQALPVVTRDFANYFPPQVLLGNGCWATTAMDYARFITAIDGQSVPADLLTTNSIKTMLTVSAASRGSDNLFGIPYGMGWFVNESTGEISHSGANPGSSSIAVRRKDGLSYVMFCSTYNPALSDTELLKTTLDSSLAAIKSWPTNDLFPATLSYEAWKARHFTTEEQAQATRSGDDADPDGDGISNLLEYAQGTDPHVADAEPWLRERRFSEGGKVRFAIECRRRPLGHAVQYQWECSSDLAEWKPLEARVTEEVGVDGMVQSLVVPMAMVSDTTAGFVRVMVSRPAKKD